MSAGQSAVPMTPPPPGGSAPPPSPSAVAAPAPATPNPQLEAASRMVIQTVQNLRAIAKQFPGTGPAISQINDLMREVQLAMMKQSQPGEPAAPPVPSA